MAVCTTKCGALVSRRREPDQLLKFSEGGNSKLPPFVTTFSILSGVSCPGALECHSWRTKEGNIKDGPHTKFRCFSASQEVSFKNTYLQRSHNYQLLKKCSRLEMVRLIEESMTRRSLFLRIHVGGDFFSQEYFDAWLLTARRNRKTVFYAYTKSLPFWIFRLNSIPDNLILTASRGGKFDHLINRYNLREAVVVFHPEEAQRLGLEVDHDDSHAMCNGPSFALLVHGTQPTGSEASIAKKRMTSENIKFSYGNNNGKRKSKSPARGS